MADYPYSNTWWRESWYDPEYLEKWKNWQEKENEKNAVNYNISTTYETKKEDNDSWWFLNTVWTLAHAINNFLFLDKDQAIERARNYQVWINELKNRYANWWLDDEQKAQVVSQIKELARNRDDALEWKWQWRWDNLVARDFYLKDLFWTNVFWLKTSDLVNSTWQWEKFNKDKDWNRKWYTTEYSNLVDSTNWKVNWELLNNIFNSNNRIAIEKYKEKIGEDIKNWKTTLEDVLQWKYVPEFDYTWSWFEWYIDNSFKRDVRNIIDPYNFALTDKTNANWVDYFFKEDADRVIDNIISDDVRKAIQNNYIVVRKIEAMLNSDDPWEVKYAQTPRIQAVYNEAVKNLWNLKEEVAYIYQNLWKFDWDIFSIEAEYQREHWRKMFSSDNNWESIMEAFDIWYDTVTSEDFWTSARVWLDYRSDNDITHEKPLSLWEMFSIRPFFNAFEFFTRKIFLETYEEWFKNARFDIDTATQKLRTEWLTWADAQDLVYWVESSMSSVRSIRDQLTNTRSVWNTIYSVSDAAPTILKEATIMYLTEGLIKSMWVMSSQEMAAIAWWANMEKNIQYIKYVNELQKAKILTSNEATTLLAENLLADTEYYRIARWVWWNKWLVEFAPKEIIQAKIWEFAWRWIVQNFILSASASSNFAEEYNDFDFKLDVAFAFIDAMSSTYWLLAWKWKITNEARKRMMRDTLRDAMWFDSDQWAKLMATEQWRQAVDEAAYKLFKIASEWIDEAAMKNKTSRQAIIDEISNRVKNTKIWSAKNWSDVNSSAVQYNRIRKALIDSIEDLQNRAVAKIIALQDKWIIPQYIRDKVKVYESTAPNWEKVYSYALTSKLTLSDIEELSKLNLPINSSWWQRFQRLLSKGKNEEFEQKQPMFADKLKRLSEIDTSTDEWKIEYQKLKQELDYEYNKMLQERIKNWDLNFAFRQWEYEKYWKPLWLPYDDKSYTYLNAWNTEKEIEEEFIKRSKEFSEDKMTTKYWRYQFEAWVDKLSIEVSEAITWKKNLIWLTYKEASEINPNLKLLPEWFFIAVSLANYLELWQKNAILWSVTKDWKIFFEAENKTIYRIKWATKSRSSKVWYVIDDIQAFWSMFEQEYVIWKIWTVGKIKLYRWTNILWQRKFVNWSYWVRKEHWIITIVIKTEDDQEYKLYCINWSLSMDRSTAHKFKWKFDISFEPLHKDRYTIWWFDLYGKKWNSIEEKLWKYKKKNPNSFEHQSTLVTVGNILNTPWDIKFSKIDERNRYQTKYAQETFSNINMLTSSQMRNWYLDILQIYDVPYSYFIEKKKMVQEWKSWYTKEKWAEEMLMSANSKIDENADFFIIKWNYNIKDKRDLMAFMMHQAWVVMMKDDKWNLVSYFYKRNRETNFLYDLYTSDSYDVSVWQLWIDIHNWDINLANIDWKITRRLDELYISKTITADIPSSRYTHFQWTWTYKSYDALEKRAYTMYKKFSQEDAHNIYSIGWKEKVTDKFWRLVKWDIRWMWYNYHRDIEVKPENKKIVSDLFYYKDLSLKKSANRNAMFYRWFENSILPRFYSDNLWISNIKEWTQKIISLKWNWTLKWINWVRNKKWWTQIIIDTKPMWFKMNYISTQQKLKWGKETTKNSIIFNIDDWNIKWWRMMAIDYVWDYWITELYWNKYLRVVLSSKDQPYEFLIKLDNSLKNLDTYDINTLSLSKGDYEVYSNWFANAISELAWQWYKWRNMNYVFEYLYAFPEEVQDMVKQWASVAVVREYMQDLINKDPFMAGIAEMKYEWTNLKRLDRLLDTYLEAQSIREEIIQPMLKEWQEITEEEVLQHYWYLFKANSKAYDQIEEILKEELWLSAYKRQKRNENAIIWLKDVISIERWYNSLSKKTFDYIQSKVIQVKLDEFIKWFYDWSFEVAKDWRKLNLENDLDYAIYIDNIKAAYEYAITPIQPSEVRWTYKILKTKVQNKYQVSKIIKQQQSLNVLSDVLIKTKELLELKKLQWAKKRDRKNIARYRELKNMLDNLVIDNNNTTNTWNDYIYNTKWERKSIANIAAAMGDYAGKNWEMKLVYKLYSSLAEVASIDDAISEINKLQKEYIETSKALKDFLDEAKENTTKPTWDIKEQLDTDIKNIEKTTISDSVTKTKVALLKIQANDIVKLKQSWKENSAEMSNAIKQYDNTKSEIKAYSEGKEWETLSETNSKILEVKKDATEVKEARKSKKITNDEDFDNSTWYEDMENMEDVEIHYDKNWNQVWRTKDFNRSIPDKYDEPEIFAWENSWSRWEEFASTKELNNHIWTLVLRVSELDRWIKNIRWKYHYRSDKLIKKYNLGEDLTDEQYEKALLDKLEETKNELDYCREMYDRMREVDNEKELEQWMQWMSKDIEESHRQEYLDLLKEQSELYKLEELHSDYDKYVRAGNKTDWLSEDFIKIENRINEIENELINIEKRYSINDEYIQNRLNELDNKIWWKETWNSEKKIDSSSEAKEEKEADAIYEKEQPQVKDIKEGVDKWNTEIKTRSWWRRTWWESSHNPERTAVNWYEVNDLLDQWLTMETVPPMWAYLWWLSWVKWIWTLVFQLKFWSKSNILLELYKDKKSRDLITDLLKSSTKDYTVLNQFVKTEEWKEMILYSLLYCLPLPKEIRQSIEDVFWVELGWNFQEAFDTMYKTYTAYENKAPRISKWQDWLYYIWVSEKDWYNTLINQYSAFWKDEIDITKKWTTTSTKFSEWWYWRYKQVKKLDIYDSSTIKNKKVKSYYEKYLYNAKRHWVNISPITSTWPLSKYEFHTLWMMAAWNKDIAKFLNMLISDSYEKSKAVKQFITYWTDFKWNLSNFAWWNEFYDNLVNRKYIDSYYKSIWSQDEKYILSPYYHNKIEYLKNNSWQSTLVVDSRTFIDNMRNEKWKDSVKWYDYILVQWWDQWKVLSEIEKYKLWWSQVYEADNIHSWKISRKWAFPWETRLTGIADDIWTNWTEKKIWEDMSDATSKWANCLLQ